jgi:hypothetical protein
MSDGEIHSGLRLFFKINHGAILVVRLVWASLTRLKPVHATTVLVGMGAQSSPVHPTFAV